MPAAASDQLETFDNQFPGRDYVVCPKTGQPDFGTLTITYTPDRKCVELKSLKLYLQSFRNQGIFYENVTNRILDDLVAALQPRRLKLVAAFTPRGGISTSVTVVHERKG
jgi:7-cyano-7-deazaguanine reductase